LAESDRSKVLGKAARQKALTLWTSEVVGNLYIQLYNSLLNEG